jgi:hypothetical protein
MFRVNLASCIIKNGMGDVLLGRYAHPLDEGPVTFELPTARFSPQRVVRHVLREQMAHQYGIDAQPIRHIGEVIFREGGYEGVSQLFETHLNPGDPLDDDVLCFRGIMQSRMSAISRADPVEYGPFASRLIEKLNREELRI